MSNKFINRITNSKLVTGFLDLCRRFKPWGFEGMSLYDVMNFFFEGILKGALTTRAVAISYRLLLNC